MGEFEGQVAIVTSAEPGIGRSTALLYAQRGARVVIANATEPGGRETVQMIKDAGGEARFIHANVSDPVACEALISQTLDAYGRLDIAFNIAGIGGDSPPIADSGMGALQEVFNISLSSMFYCMKYEIRAMLKNRRGAIVNMSSILGQVESGIVPTYISAKHAVVGSAQTSAGEYTAAGIRINAVGSASTRTPPIARPEQVNSLQYVGRLSAPEEVAELVLWLSSIKPSLVVGAYV